VSGHQKFLDQLARAKPKSLHLSNNLPIDKWCQIGRQLAALSEASGWWLGDWIVYGEQRYPDRYKEALEGTSLEYQTLRNYAWVARRFPPTRRREKLSLQHHAEVAALPEAEQDEWLDRAEKFRWSRNQLRAYLKASQQPGPESPNVAASKENARALGAARKKVVLQLEVEQERQDAWLAAAKDAESFEEWAIQVLDYAAKLQQSGNTGLLPGLPLPPTKALDRANGG
jgi:hypothetical protein